MEKDQRYVVRVVECFLVIKFFCCCCLFGWLGVSLFFARAVGQGHALGDLCHPPRVKPVPSKLEGQSLKAILFHKAAHFVSWVVHLL